MSDTPLSAQRYISQACEEDLQKYGDSFRGAGYTKSGEEAAQRYALMLGVIQEARDPVTLLDFGCGFAHLLEFMQRNKRYPHVQYTGLDLSPKYLEAAKARHAEQSFLLLDVLQDEDRLPQFDYAIMNGVFNFRGTLSQEAMLSYWRQLTTTVFRHCRRGLAFNVMSRLVDWERDDLFHVSFDTLGQHVAQSLSRHFVIRHDYGAYEYTTYVYRSPSAT